MPDPFDTARALIEARLAQVVDLSRPPKTAEQWQAFREQQQTLRDQYVAADLAWVRRRRKIERALYLGLAVLVVWVMAVTFWPGLPADAAVWAAVAPVLLYVVPLGLLFPARNYPEAPEGLLTEFALDPLKPSRYQEVQRLAETDGLVAEYVRSALAQGRDLLNIEFDVIAARAERMESDRRAAEAEAAGELARAQLRGA